MHRRLPGWHLPPSSLPGYRCPGRNLPTQDRCPLRKIHPGKCPGVLHYALVGKGAGELWVKGKAHYVISPTLLGDGLTMSCWLPARLAINSTPGFFTISDIKCICLGGYLSGWAKSNLGIRLGMANFHPGKWPQGKLEGGGAFLPGSVSEQCNTGCLKKQEMYCSFISTFWVSRIKVLHIFQLPYSWWLKKWP